MMLRPLKTAATFALLLLPSLLLAQEISSSEELRLEALARAQAEIYIPRNHVAVGFRVLNSGAKVHFGNLGQIPFATTPAAIADGNVARIYDNGHVLVDTPRGNEVDTDGIQTSTPGGRYQTTQTVTTNVTDANGNVIGTVDTVVVVADLLSYTPGLTRSWSYSAPEQAAARPGYIALSSYSAVSAGASLDKKQGPVGGVELQFARTLGKATGRLQWSLLTGISLNDINNKTNSDVTATLLANTDFYSLNGQTAPPTTLESPYTAPLNATGALETTTPISQVPTERVSTSTVGGATVHGKYQVKGAYFMLKVGPSMHTQLTERLGLSASVGLAGAYSGTHYTAFESMNVPLLNTSISTADPESSDTSKFLSGYYADLNLEWLANESTGLFGGVTAQSFGYYNQTVGERTAKIDIGSSVGLRGGISIKF
jgi:hypothetical protein